MTNAPNGSRRTYQTKVDGFIRDALGETNLFLRAKLLGKAVYWNLMAMKADPDIKFVRGKPIAPGPSQETS